MAHAMNVGRRGFVAGSGKTVEEFNAATHYEADNVLSHTVKEGFEPLLHWLEDMGMPVNVSYDIATPFGGMADEQGNGGAAGPITSLTSSWPAIRRWAAGCSPRRAGPI